MSAIAVPSNADEALRMLESALGFLAAEDAAEMPGEAVAECLRALERADAVEAAARGRLLEAFDAQDAHLADGQRTTRTWLVHTTRVTKGQAAEHQAIQAPGPRPPGAADRPWPRDTCSPSRSPCSWPGGPAPSRMSTAARPRRSWSPPPGPGRTCGRWPRSARRSAPAPPPPDHDDDNDQHLDRGRVPGHDVRRCRGHPRRPHPPMRRDGPGRAGCAVRPAGGGDLRTRPQRYHDALAEAMRRLENAS